jgi:hypothetical protein
MQQIWSGWPMPESGHIHSGAPGKTLASAIRANAFASAPISNACQSTIFLLLFKSIG